MYCVHVNIFLIIPKEIIFIVKIRSAFQNPSVHGPEDKVNSFYSLLLLTMSDEILAISPLNVLPSHVLVSSPALHPTLFS